MSLPQLPKPTDGKLGAQLIMRVAEIRCLRDQYGWPEPRTVHELREDPRVMLRNRLDLIEPTVDDLLAAASLIMLVASDLAFTES